MTEWAVKLHDRIVKRFTLQEGARVVIGRGTDADIVLDNTAISRHHLALENKSGISVVRDLGSLNGTFLGNQKIDDETVVTPTDEIIFGKFTLAIHDGTETDAAFSSLTPMDLEEETVFVQKAKAAKADSSEKGMGRHTLKVVGGSASPMDLNLDGKKNVKIGKDPSCNMVIDGWFVPKAQCYIINRDGKYFVNPQRSWIGTYLNGSKITEEKQLRKDDIITIRSTKIRFS